MREGVLTIDLSHPITDGMVTYPVTGGAAVPAPVRGLGTFPVRAFATVG